MEEELLQQEQEQNIPVEAPEIVSVETSPEEDTMARGAREEAVTEAPVTPPVNPPKVAEESPLMFPDMGQEESVLDFGELQSIIRPEMDEAPRVGMTNTYLSILKEEGYTPPATEAEEAQLEVAAAEKVKQKRDAAIRANADIQIANSQDSAEVLQVVEDVRREESKPVTVADMRSEALLAEYKPTSDIYMQPSREIAQNMKLAQLAQKASDNIWDETGWFDALLDITEVFSPTYLVSERMDKTAIADSGIVGFLTMGGAYEDLAEKLSSLPFEERERAVNVLIDEIVAQETVLFRNGNSLLQTDQLSLLAQTLRDGFAASTSDSFDGTEGLEYLFGITDAALSLGAYTRSARGFIKGMLRKVGPASEQAAYAGAKQNIGSIADARNAADPIAARRNAYNSGAPLGVMKEGGLPEFAAAQRFMPVNDLGELDFIPSVSYKGKMVPLDVMKRLLDDLGVAERKAGRELYDPVDGNKLISPAIKEDMRDALRKAISGDIVFTPRPVLHIPKYGDNSAARGAQASENATSIKTPEQVVKEFDEAVDSAVQGDALPADLQWTAPDPRAISDSLKDIGLVQGIDESDYAAREAKMARDIESATGGSLKHNPSMTVWRANSERDSLGEFKIYLGDGDTGFKTADEARAAGIAAIGEDLRPVPINGRWYLEKEFTHRYDPRLEAGVVDEARVSSLNPLAAWFLNPMRKLSSSNLRDVMANVEVNRAIASDVLEPAKKSMKALKEGEAVRVSTLLSKGNEAGKAYTRKEAGYVVGKLLSDNEWQAYKDVRKVFDAHYEVTNNSFRKSADRAGWKSVRVAGSEDRHFGPVIKKEKVTELADEVFDARDGVAKNADELLDEEDVVFMRVYTRLIDGDKRYTVVATRAEDVGQLPANMIHYREGHVPRMYQDRKFKITLEEDTVINGRTVSYTRAVGIARTEAEAQKIREAFVAKGYAPEKLSQPVRTVENPAEDVAEFMDDISVMGYVPTNAKARGDQLLDATMNPARIADPIDAAASSMFKIERELNRDVVATLEQKFLNTWREYLVDMEGKPVKGFPREGQLRFRKDVPESVQKQIDNFHEYVVTMDNIRVGKIAKMFNSALEAVENSLYKSLGFKASERTKRLIDGDAQRAFMSFANYAFIIGRPVFQIPTNMLQTLNIMVRYPVTGSFAAARAIFVGGLLAARGTKGFEGMLKAFAKTGYSEDELRGLLSLIDETGIVKTTGSVDDYLGLSRAGLRKVGEDGLISKMIGGGIDVTKKVAGAPLRVSAKAQEGSINYVNLVALIAEYDRVLASGVKLTGKVKSDILIRARRLTQTQNSMDRFAYQDAHNPLQLMFQFAQHVNKIFLDIALEPYVKLVTGKGLGREAGIFSETRGVAARTAALTFMLFGMNGMPIGSDNAGNATNYMREMFIQTYGRDLPDELWTVVQGGSINLLFNSMIDGKVDVTARVSPSAFVDFAVDMFNDLSLDVLGAVGGLTETVVDIGYGVAVLASTPDLSAPDKALGILKETASLFSGYKDYERAEIAKTWLQHPYMGTLSGDLRVTYEEAIFNYFSINPKMVEDLYRTSSFTKGRERNKVQNVSRVMVRQMNRELTQLKQGGVDLSTSGGYFQVMDIVQKWSNAAKAHIDPSLHDDVIQQFESYMLRENGEGFQSFIAPYINGTDNETKLRRLKRLREEVQFEDYRDIIDNNIQYLEGM